MSFEFVRVENGQIFEEPLLDFLVIWLQTNQVTLEMMRDLTWIGQEQYNGMSWLPIEDQSAPLQRYQSYTENYTLMLDAPRFVVVRVREVRDWTAQEILDYKSAIQRHITYAAFRRRFTHAERVALEVAALDTPGADPAVRAAAAEVRVIERDIASAKYVDLNLPEVRANIQLRETLGLIAAGRADEIIWGDLEDSEVA